MYRHFSKSWKLVAWEVGLLPCARRVACSQLLGPSFKITLLGSISSGYSDHPIFRCVFLQFKYKIFFQLSLLRPSVICHTCLILLSLYLLFPKICGNWWEVVTPSGQQSFSPPQPTPFFPSPHTHTLFTAHLFSQPTHFKVRQESPGPASAVCLWGSSTSTPNSFRGTSTSSACASGPSSPATTKSRPTQGSFAFSIMKYCYQGRPRGVAVFFYATTQWVLAPIVCLF